MTTTTATQDFITLAARTATEYTACERDDPAKPGLFKAVKERLAASYEADEESIWMPMTGAALETLDLDELAHAFIQRRAAA